MSLLQIPIIVKSCTALDMKIKITNKINIISNPKQNKIASIILPDEEFKEVVRKDTCKGVCLNNLILSTNLYWEVWV